MVKSLGGLFNYFRFVLAAVLMIALFGCADTRQHETGDNNKQVASFRIHPEIFVVHSGRSIKLDIEATAKTRERLIWSVRNSTGEESTCAGSVDREGTFTAGSALGGFYYVHATDGSNSAVTAVARGEIVANPEPDLDRAIPESWRSRDHRLFQTRYPEELAADEQRVSDAVFDAIAGLDKRFADDVRPLEHQQYRLTVNIYPHSTHRASPSRATIVTRRRHGKGVAELHLLAPSRYCGAAPGRAEPLDQASLQKLIAHEVSTLYLDELTHRKATGWRFFSAPHWFVQGYEEYLALELISGQPDVKIQKNYMVRVTDDPERVSLGILTRSAYIDGAVLMKFLHETYGADAVRKLLTSDQPSFWLAMKIEMGLQPGLFVERFQRWLAQQEYTRLPRTPQQ